MKNILNLSLVVILGTLVAGCKDRHLDLLVADNTWVGAIPGSNQNDRVHGYFIPIVISSDNDGKPRLYVLRDHPFDSQEDATELSRKSISNNTYRAWPERWVLERD